MILWHLVLPGMAIGCLGWMLYRFGLPIIGAVVGAGAGGALGYLGSALIQAPWALAFFTGVGLVGGGVAGIFLMRALQLYFFFATGATMGGALAYNLIETGLLAGMATRPGGLGTLIIVACGAVAGGLLLLWMRRFIVAIVTAIFGAVLTAQGFPEQYMALALVIALVVYLAIQIGLVQRFVDREQFDERARRKLRGRELDYPDVDSAD